MKTNRKTTAVMRAPLEAGDNIPNIAKTKRYKRTHVLSTTYPINMNRERATVNSDPRDAGDNMPNIANTAIQMYKHY